MQPNTRTMNSLEREQRLLNMMEPLNMANMYGKHMRQYSRRVTTLQELSSRMNTALKSLMNMENSAFLDSTLKTGPNGYMSIWHAAYQQLLLLRSMILLAKIPLSIL